jgi:hypothetical protein
MAIFSALSGVISQQGAQAGGNMAASAANQAAQMQQNEAMQARAALSPWVAAGGGAIGKVTNLLGLGTLKTNGGNFNTYGLDPAGAKETQQQALADFETSPGYQFRMDEGSKALDRSAASRGLLRSGAQQKAITAFGQGIASEEYGNYMNNLFQAAGLGSQAASSGNSTAAGLTANAGSLIAQGGAARGSGYAAGANALASGISSGVRNATSLLSYGGSGGKLGLPGWS